MLISSVDSFPMLTSSRQVAAAHKSLPSGATIRKIAGDGNCLFRALSLSIFGTQEQHTVLRNQIVANVVQNWSHYSSYIVGDISYGHPIKSANDYKNHMSKNGAEGGHLELNVATRIYDISIKVYNSKTSKVITLGNCKYKDKKEIDLLYTGEGDKGHYDAIFLDGRKVIQNPDDKNANEPNKKASNELNNNSLINDDDYDDSLVNVETVLEEDSINFFSSSKPCDNSKSKENLVNSSSESPRKTRQSAKADLKSDKSSSKSTEMVLRKGHKKASTACGSLHLECQDDPLSTAQEDVINKAKKDYGEAINVLNSLVAKFDGEVFEKGEVTICQLKSLLSLTPVPPPTSPVSPITVIPSAAVSPTGPAVPLVNVRPQQALLTTPSATGYQFVMNNASLGLLVPNTSATVPVPRPPAPVISNVRTPVSFQNKVGRQIVRPLNTSTPNTQQTGSRMPLKAAILQKTTPVVSPITPAPANQKIKAKPKTQPVAPTTATATTPNSASGPKVRKLSTLVDLTNDDGKAQNQESDSREMVFNKVSGKTFPSLVVIARPNLRAKEFPQSVVAQERKSLDADVKNVLMYQPPKFCEWLIQQGLISSEQHCSVHVYPDMSPVKLKLGMYSDASKFPFSGGYVWISDCCPAKFVSVFCDSLFESSSTPTITLKLIYHWACQTSVSNVVQWVKVDNLYVKNFYTHMRAVCTAALHDKLTKIGGPRKRIEVGVISLGTTSADGHLRQVKVEVLGVLDPETKQIFLRAVEPTPDSEKNYKRRFSKILEHLETWVHKSSVILTDFTVDKGTLTSMGFSSVYQVSINDSANATNKYSNYNIMEYLRRIVPRMFQNTLSLLSRNIIQQFLDELVWREMYGPTAARAYKTITQHIAEQTKLKITGETLLSRLTKIALNPFKNWSSAAQQSNAAAAAAAATAASVPITQTKPTPEKVPPVTGIDALPASITQIDDFEITKKPEGPAKRKKQTNGLGPASKRPSLDVSKLVPTKPTAPLEPLNSYYYGTYQSNSEIINSEEKVDLNMKCCVCKDDFQNNMQLMMHLVYHALNSEAQKLPKRLDPLCKYCLKSFTSPFNLMSHIEEAHSRASSELRCLICEEKFRDRSSQILHMHREHCELELPYECGICYYRTSEHKKVVDHYYEEHDGTGKVQCPLCLKIIVFKTNDRNVSKNRLFFLQHIQKHHRKSIARKCDKCELQFVHKGILKEHKDKDHVSYVGVPGVQRYESNLDSVMMPRPPVNNTNNFKKVVQKNLLEATGYRTFTTNRFISLKLKDLPEEVTCCECEGFMTSEDHFEGRFSCIICTYSTCCGKAMFEHSQIFHSVTGTQKEVFNMGTPIILPNVMYCVCGYKSRSGNKLAKHLAQCKRKSAYPSAERAAQSTVQTQSASFPPLVTLDDADLSDPSDRWLKAFATTNENAEKTPPQPRTNLLEAPPMLNVLGLARKDPADDRNSKASVRKLDSPASVTQNHLMNNDSRSNSSPKLYEDLEEKLSGKNAPSEVSKIRIKSFLQNDVQPEKNGDVATIKNAKDNDEMMVIDEKNDEVVAIDEINDEIIAIDEKNDEIIPVDEPNVAQAEGKDRVAAVKKVNAVLSEEMDAIVDVTETNDVDAIGEAKAVQSEVNDGAITIVETKSLLSEENNEATAIDETPEKITIVETRTVESNENDAIITNDKVDAVSEKITIVETKTLQSNKNDEIVAIDETVQSRKNNDLAIIEEVQAAVESIQFLQNHQDSIS